MTDHIVFDPRTVYLESVVAPILAEEAAPEFKVGDRVHAGLANPGGAGFEGIVQKIVDGWVWLELNDVFAKFGPRIIKAPIRNVIYMGESKNVMEASEYANCMNGDCATIDPADYRHGGVQLSTALGAWCEKCKAKFPKRWAAYKTAITTGKPMADSQEDRKRQGVLNKGLYFGESKKLQEMDNGAGNSPGRDLGRQRGDPKTYLGGPDENGLYVIYNQGQPLNVPRDLETCKKVAAQYKIQWPLPRYDGEKFVTEAPEYKNSQNDSPELLKRTAEGLAKVAYGDLVDGAPCWCRTKLRAGSYDKHYSWCLKLRDGYRELLNYRKSFGEGKLHEMDNGKVAESRKLTSRKLYRESIDPDSDDFDFDAMEAIEDIANDCITIKGASDTKKFYGWIADRAAKHPKLKKYSRAQILKMLDDGHF